MKNCILFAILLLPFHYGVGQCFSLKETADPQEAINLSKKIYDLVFASGLYDNKIHEEKQVLTKVPFLFDTVQTSLEKNLQPGTWLLDFEKQYSYTCKVHVYEYIPQWGDTMAAFRESSEFLKIEVVSKFFDCRKYRMAYGKSKKPVMYIIEYTSLTPKTGASPDIQIPLCFFSQAYFYNGRDKQAKGAWISIRMNNRSPLAKK